MDSALLILCHPAMHNAIASLNFTPKHPAMSIVQIPRILFFSFLTNSFRCLSQNLFKLSHRLASSLRTRGSSQISFLYFLHDDMIHMCLSDSRPYKLFFCSDLPPQKVQHQPLISRPENRVKGSRLRHRCPSLHRKIILAIERHFSSMTPSRVVESRVGGIFADVGLKLTPKFFPVLHAIVCRLVW